MIRRFLAVCSLLVLCWGGPVWAVNPDEMLSDAVLEARARHLSTELRCLVCQNQSIDDSNADLAHDLRVLVRERLKAGDSDRQVLDYLRARYGDFVLLRPPMERATWVLWFVPPVALILILGLGMMVLRSRRVVPAPAPLNDQEARRLADILGEDAP